MSVTIKQVCDVLNTAADDIIARANLATDSAVSDAMNLLTNVAVHRLSAPDTTVDDVIRANYSSEPEEVLSWL